ncbi:MAG TPA: T9SS type A sorting domain-containing protein [Ignavibacteria bacterium]|nr:T9SS type A sorting domain-containing protein [Ignavibacteria bacterium]
MGGSGTSNTINIYNNTIMNCSLPSITTGLFYAIYQNSSAFNLNIYNNQIINNLYGAGSTTATGAIAGIYVAGGSISLGTWQVYNNTINNLSRVQSVLGAGVNYGIYANGTGPTFNVNGNIIRDCSWNSAGLSYCINNSNNNPSTLNINNNTIDNIQRNSRSAGTTYGIYLSNTKSSSVNNVNNNNINNINNYPTSTTFYFGGFNYGIYTENSTTSNITINENTIDSLQLNGFGITYGINNSIAGTLTVTNNNISRLINSHTGQVYGIYQNPGNTCTINCNNNTLNGFRNDSNSVFGIYNTSGIIINIFRNNLYDFLSTGAAGNFYGIGTGSGTIGATTNIYNNYISDLNAPSSSVNFSAGLYLYGTTANTHKYYNNTLFLNQGSSASPQINGLYASVIPTLDLRNNIIVVNCTSAGGINTAYSRSGTDLSTYSNNSNYNDFYSGGAGSTNKYFFDGTNTDLTLTDYKIRVSPKDVNSFSEIPPFKNTISAPYNLRIDSTISTQCESFAQVISSPAITTDYDQQPRYPNIGYPQHGSGSYSPDAPDVGADEFGGIPGDVTGPSISYTPLTNGIVSSNRGFSNVTITDPSGINTSSGTKPRCYYKKSTDNNTYSGNTACDNGWKWVESNGTSTPFDFTIDYTKLFDPLCVSGSVSASDVIQYFVVAQDNSPAQNVGINSGIFNSQPSSVNLSASQFPLTGTIRQYIIGSSLSGIYPVGISEIYTSLTGPGGFFEAINNSTVSGDIKIQITSNLNEDGTNALNEISYSSGSYTISIVPASASEKLISGSVSQAMMRFNSSDNINIDGNNGLSRAGTKYLRFRNIDGSAPTIEFKNDAKNNTISNCFIEGNNSDNTEGVILFGTTTETDGNDNNSITDCDIRDRSDLSGLPAALIVNNGTTSSTAHYNSNITVSGCNLYNFYQDAAGGITGAILLWNGTTDWTITNNSIYQESARSFINPESIYTVWNNSNSANNLILTGNYIGGSAPMCGGSAMTLSSANTGITFHGIRLFVGSTTASSIQGNTISNISFTTKLTGSSTQTFSAIILPSATGLCNIGNMSGNIIGSSSITGSISINISATGAVLNSTSAGIYNLGSGSIQNNTIGSINLNASGISDNVSFYAVYMTGNSPASVNITDNIIGSTSAANSINNLSSSIPFDFTGIRISSDVSGTLTINNNIIKNITDASSNSASQVKGIFFSGSATSGISITNNTIGEISTSTRNAAAPNGNSTIGAAYGIISSSPSSNQNISGNTVSGLRSTATGAYNTVVKGICVMTNSTGTMNSNKVYDLTNIATGSSAYIYGLYAYYGNWTCSNNMVSITNGESSDNQITSEKNYSAEIRAFKKNEIINNNKVNVYVPPVITSIYNLNNLPFSEDSKTIYSQIIDDKLEDKPAAYRNLEVSQDNFLNGLLIQGIHDEAGPGTWNFYYNTVYIGGNNGTGTGYSTCYSREISATVASLNNNLFVNSRQGTGTHLAIRSTVTGSWNSNYNAFITPDTNFVGLWSATSYPIDGWRSNSGGDKQSWAASSIVINPANLFNSISTCDLNIITSNQEAWLVSGKGIANSIGTDINGGTRVTSISSGVTDIGADEFDITSLTNPSAVEMGTISGGSSTEYRLYGRTISRIDWGTGGTSYPTSLDIKYFSGEDPPNILVGFYGKSYWKFTPAGSLSGTTYNISLYFGNNETYIISTPGSNTILARYDSGWEAFPAGIGPGLTELTWNSGTGTYITKVPGLSSFSDFALTDNSNPLPVQFLSFNAVINNQRTVHLAWVTVYETNNAGFDIERRTVINSGNGEKSYSDWKKLIFTAGNGTTNHASSYSYIDRKLNTGIYEYRLKQIDYNGSYEYFNLNNPKYVEIGKPYTAEIFQSYPNPSNPKSKIDFQIPYSAKVTIVIYNLLGEEVSTIINGYMQEGYYTAEFDGTNLASGVYFYKIIAVGEKENFSKTQKLILIK